MLRAHQRFPSRGSFGARSRIGGGAEGPMLTAPPPEPPHARASRLAGGELAPGAKPIQNLVGTAIRELWTSMLDIGTAIRLGDTAARPRYFGTVTPQPQIWRTPSDLNSPDSVEAAVINAGNAPEMMNKSASSGAMPGPPRVASKLPPAGVSR